MGNEFWQDLGWSFGQSDQPFWEEVYRQAFPGFSTMHDVRKDGWAQRGGIDRQVILDDGTVLKIDEKCRRKSYGDILLEVYSDTAKKTPGWIAKPLTCDFIAYAFVPDQTCYLLPYQPLRTAWFRNRSHWRDNCRHVKATNPGYVTTSYAVPIDELLMAIQATMTIHWGQQKRAAA